MKEFILKDPIGITSPVMEDLKKLRFGEGLDLYEGRIMDSTRQHLFFFLTPTHPPDESARNAELVHGIDSLVNSFNGSREGIEVGYFGSTPVTVANSEQIKKDIYLTVSIAALALLVLVAFYFRKLRTFFLIFIPVVLGAALSIGLIALFFEGISAIALGMGSVMLGITIDYSLHILTHFRNSGSAEKTLRDLATPVLMSAATTASAFVCLLFLRAPALHDLGLFASLSVLVAAIMALVLLPLFMKGSSPKEDEERRRGDLLQRVASYPLHRKKPWVIAVLLFTILCAFTHGKVGFEDDLSKMNYMPEHLEEAQEEIQAVNEFAHRSIYLLSSGNDLDEALEKDRKLGRRIDSLEREGVVDRSVQPARFLIPTSVQKERIRRWKAYWDEEKRQEVKKVLRKKGQELGFKASAFEPFYELLEKEHQPISPSELGEFRDLLLDRYIAEGKGESTVASLLKVASDGDADRVFETVGQQDGVNILDREYLATKFIRLLKEDFSRLLSLSLLVVGAILLLAFGRIELTLITFIPMSLGWLWTVGVMGLSGVDFNIFNIVICTFVFGLGIDHSIFISRAYLQDLKFGEKSVPSYKTSILLSAITTIVGFGVLILAEHPALRSIALMSVIGVLSVVLVAFTLQPLFFDWMILSRKRKGHPPITFANFLASLLIFIVFILGCLFMTLMGAIFLLPPYRQQKKRKRFYHWLLMWTSRLIIYLPFHIRKRIINEAGEGWDRPAVILSNHQSHIDLPLILMLHPRIIVLTTDWVWNNPFYGAIVKLCEFYPVSMGHDRIAELLEEKVKDGYSVLVFPEGTRSKDQRIQRFHKGGFYLAQKLDLEILPILLHGPGDVMPKGDNRLRKGSVTMRIMPRIDPKEGRIGETPREMAKRMARFYREEFSKTRTQLLEPSYLKGLVIKNYIMKGPQLEWYLKSKFRMENDYKGLHERIPRKGEILDIGCGYGHMDLLFALLEPERRIHAIDHDEEKVRIAQECPSKPENLSFERADAEHYQLPESDVYLMGDLLHYLPQDSQRRLVEACMKKLRPGGSILIRDADRDLKERHKRTERTEFFSTRSGFNKAKYPLEFISGQELRDLVSSHGFELEVQDEGRSSSDVLYIVQERTEAGNEVESP